MNERMSNMEGRVRRLPLFLNRENRSLIIENHRIRTPLLGNEKENGSTLGWSKSALRRGVYSNSNSNSNSLLQVTH